MVKSKDMTDIACDARKKTVCTQLPWKLLDVPLRFPPFDWLRHAFYGIDIVTCGIVHRRVRVSGFEGVKIGTRLKVCHVI
jgi:hypothetical protein